MVLFPIPSSEFPFEFPYSKATFNRGEYLIFLKGICGKRSQHAFLFVLLLFNLPQSQATGCPQLSNCYQLQLQLGISCCALSAHCDNCNIIVNIIVNSKFLCLLNFHVCQRPGDTYLILFRLPLVLAVVVLVVVCHVCNTCK